MPNYVGKPITRYDGVGHVTGRTIYVDDIQLPGMLYMKALRSPYPHARIMSIDTNEAERIPGVKSVVTNRDAPQGRWGNGMIRDQTVLAKDVVRYVGEPVAAVAAETIDAAEAAINLIKIELVIPWLIPL